MRIPLAAVLLGLSTACAAPTIQDPQAAVSTDRDAQAFEATFHRSADLDPIVGADPVAAREASWTIRPSAGRDFPLFEAVVDDHPLDIRYRDGDVESTEATGEPYPVVDPTPVAVRSDS